MDEEEHERQVMMMNEELDPNADTTEHVVEYCMLECGETPDVAWKLCYEHIAGKVACTGWLYICELCDGESRMLAPYWWNKALRGESLDDEEE